MHVTDSPPAAPALENDRIAALRDAVAKAGSGRKLAKAIGRAQQHIVWLLRGQYPVSAEDSVAIERATGVPRWRLRPDLWPPPLPAPSEPANDTRQIGAAA